MNSQSISDDQQPTLQWLQQNLQNLSFYDSRNIDPNRYFERLSYSELANDMDIDSNITSHLIDYQRMKKQLSWPFDQKENQSQNQNQQKQNHQNKQKKDFPYHKRRQVYLKSNIKKFIQELSQESIIQHVLSK